MNYEQMKLENVLNSIYNNKLTISDDLRQLLLNHVKEEGNYLIFAF